MTSPSAANVPSDIAKVRADETKLETDTATLAADDAGTTPVTPPTPPTPPTPTTVTPTINAGQAPSGVTVPTKAILDVEFEGLTELPSTLGNTWYGNNGATQNSTVMEESNVSLGSGGLSLTLTTGRTGGIVCSDPQAAGGKGFTYKTTSSEPVFIEFKASIPKLSNGEVDNWPALWETTISSWQGETDLLESLSGLLWAHVLDNQGATAPTGIQYKLNPNGTDDTLGCLRQYSGLRTFFVNGVKVGSIQGLSESTMTEPWMVVMENSLAPSNRPTPASLPQTVIVRYVRVFQGA
jgi:hypothetical protein